MATLESIKALRNVIQTLVAEREDIGPYLLSDLKHDERAILGSPSKAFAWLVESNGRSTHFLWAEEFPPAWRDSRKYMLSGRQWIRAVCDAFRPHPMSFYFWNGRSLESLPTEQALAERFEEFVQPELEASRG